MNSFHSYTYTPRQSEFWQEVLNSIKETLTKTNPEYDIIIKRLHLYYNMKLVTFRIDRN